MMDTIAPTLQVIILAAGEGRRMRSKLPKVLHQFCGLSLLERTVNAVAELKPVRIIVVVGHGEVLVRQELKRLMSKVDAEFVIAHQTEQRGTGDAVRVALASCERRALPTLILPGDVPLMDGKTLGDFLKFHNEKKNPVLSLLSFTPRDPSGYGRVVRDGAGNVLKVVEQRDATSTELEIGEVNSSIYLVQEAFLSDGVKLLTNANAQGEFYLTDIIERGVQGGVGVYAYLVRDEKVVSGANTRAELAALVKARRKEINHRLMLAGVTLEDPRTTYIDEQVEVGIDVYLGAGVRLSGRTVVGDGVVVEGVSQITNCSIGAGSRVRFGCDIENSQIGENCQIGPFAHLRPGSVLENGARIGNFVETKNARLGPGAKANHLTYLGDAEVGAEANVGAGTITCNYDGVNKHRTVIENGAFIGSNTSLVAPVKIGTGAVIGAGSVITKNVPDGALGIERSEQTVIADWVSKKARRKKHS